MREITFIGAVNEALHQAMAEDDSVMVLGENIRGTMRPETSGLDAAFAPERVLDMPISEAAFTGFANGAALAGMRPSRMASQWPFRSSRLSYPSR